MSAPLKLYSWYILSYFEKIYLYKNTDLHDLKLEKYQSLPTFIIIENVKVFCYQT